MRNAGPAEPGWSAGRVSVYPRRHRGVVQHVLPCMRSMARRRLEKITSAERAHTSLSE